MPIVKVNKNTYEVDPLYQWDLGQELEIYGLSLASAPEVHFWQAYMELAVVKYATMDAAGVVQVSVPDALLQKPYKLHVFVCLGTGSSFKTVCKIEVPVNARAKPADYAIEDEDLTDQTKYTLAQLVASAEESERNAANSAALAASYATKAANSASAAEESAAAAAKSAAEAVAALAAVPDASGVSF